MPAWMPAEVIIGVLIAAFFLVASEAHGPGWITTTMHNANHTEGFY